MTFALANAAGCGGCGAEPALDGGVEVPAEDAGTGGDGADAGKPDAGKKPDAGPVFRTGYADEECPEESYQFEVPDGGFPDGTVIRGLCIALTRLTGTATLDGNPVKEPIYLKFDGIAYASELDVPADGAGNYFVDVMRGRYEQLLYRPTELRNHGGTRSFGTLDMRKDQTRSLGVKTWSISGAAFFAGQPWPSSQNPPDVQVFGAGSPGQSAWDQNIGGSYEVRMMEGAFAYSVSVPFAALGDTELIRYPVQPWVDFKEDKTIDIDIPTSELSGNFTWDGQPFPDRIPNQPEYRLEYLVAGSSAPIAASLHHAGSPFYAAVVPKKTYSIFLELFEVRDPSLPAILYNKQIASSVDLSQNQTLDLALTTHKVEGAIFIDGVPVQPNPGSDWLLYAYSRTTAGNPWFLAYYRVPFTSSAFSLRMLPSSGYYLALYLDSHLHPDFAKGWFVVDEQLPIFNDQSLPIDIPTNVMEGTILIDGVPAANEFTHVGTLYFESPDGWLQRQVHTTDGTFRVRLPQASYQVWFEINPEAYPDYASGRQPMPGTYNLTQPVTFTFEYETVPVAGPLLIAGEKVPDTFSIFPEVALSMERTTGFLRFYKALQGGNPWYFMRVPKGSYKLTFEIAEEVLPNVAHGDAPLGNNLVVAPP